MNFLNWKDCDFKFCIFTMTLVFLTYFIQILDKSTLNFSLNLNEQINSHGKSDPHLWVGFQFDTLFVVMIRLIQKGVLKLKRCPHFTGFSSSLDFLKCKFLANTFNSLRWELRWTFNIVEIREGLFPETSSRLEKKYIATSVRTE